MIAPLSEINSFEAFPAGSPADLTRAPLQREAMNRESQPGLTGMASGGDLQVCGGAAGTLFLRGEPTRAEGHGGEAGLVE
jgi:hypothetical protein